MTNYNTNIYTIVITRAITSALRFILSLGGEWYASNRAYTSIH